MQTLQLILNGLMAGTILAVPAIGLTAIFAVLRFTNFALASHMTIGAYAGFVANVSFGMPVYLSLLAAFVIAGLVGWLSDEFVLKPFRAAGFITTAIGSIALTIALENVVRFIFGNAMRGYKLPLQRDWVIGGLRIGPQQVENLVIALIVMALLFAFLALTRSGKAMRAVADNPMLARVAGIDPERIAVVSGPNLALEIAKEQPTAAVVSSPSLATASDVAATASNRYFRCFVNTDVIGTEFADNAIKVNAVREGVFLTGLAGLPSYNRASATHQFAYVNGRPVKDKQIAGAIRAAYMDAMARDRHAVAVLFLELEPGLVDVNVHPAKADVRFRDPGLVRGLIIGAIREALSMAGIRPATTGASSMMDAFRSGTAPYPPGYGYRSEAPSGGWSTEASPLRPHGFGEEIQARFDHAATPSAFVAPLFAEPSRDHPLGAARAQIGKNYIVAESGDSLILVDQHAAHERLVYEAFKSALQDRALPSQLLLIPEIIDLPQDDADRLSEQAETFSRFGLMIERFGPGAVAVRATPSMLGKVDVPAMIRDLADELADQGVTDGLSLRIDAIASRMACHGSVRSGRILKPDEMNALLRQMESTPNSGTCNHGRPTFIELKLADIERLFGRK